MAQRFRPFRSFALRYVVLLVVLSAAVSTDAFMKSVSLPLDDVIASLSAALLHLFEPSARSVGAVLSSAGSSVLIGQGCNGIEVFAILLPAFVAAPASVGARVAGMTATMGVVTILNVLRVITLLKVQGGSGQLFSLAHLYIWPALLIAASLALFIFWLQRFAATPE